MLVNLRVFKVTICRKLTALEADRGMPRIRLGCLRKHIILEDIGCIFWTISKVAGLRVVPEIGAVVRVPVDDHVTDARGDEGTHDETGEVVIREPRRKHSAIDGFGKARTDPKTHGLNAKLVEVVARQVFDKGFAYAVKAVWSLRDVCINGLCALVEADCMYGACIDDASHAL